MISGIVPIMYSQYQEHFSWDGEVRKYILSRQSSLRCGRYFLENNFILVLVYAQLDDSIPIFPHEEVLVHKLDNVVHSAL